MAVAGHGHEEDEEADSAPHVGVDRWDFTRLGDVVIRAGLHPQGSSFLGLRFGLGLRLPTGSTDIRNRGGNLAEPTLQPGTGALGLVVDAGYDDRAAVAGKELRWFVSSLWRWNAAGSRGYRIGADWMTHAGVHVLLHPRVEYLTQIAVRWRDRDDAGRTSELVDATGGSVLFISPGIRLELTRDLWLE